MAVMGLGYCVFWAAHLVGVLNRRAFRPVDRVFWFGVLLIPFVGLILYRGLAPEFIKKKSRRKA